MGSNNDVKSSKLGRKGDPRMHRAVSARLANPEISLFDALRIGGFQYPTNDDSSVMDAEKVTLGQRKNQLSRRLRLARKSGLTSNHNTASQSDNGEKQDDGKIVTATAGGGDRATRQDSDNRSNSHHSRGSNVSSRNKNSTTRALALQMQQDQPALHGFDDGDLDSTMDLNQDSGYNKRPRTARDHPDFSPLFVSPPFRGSGGGSRGGEGGGSSHQTPTATNQGGRHNFGSGASTGSVMSGMNVMGGSNFHVGQQTGGGGGGSGSTTPPTLFTQQIRNAFNAQQAQQTRASSVAISSLTNSAQSVGMTLEQLAMTLASNPGKLAEITSVSDSHKKKQKIALALYETECRSMYSKCMLMSGISPQLCQPGSQEYLNFALKAWKLEGERLHDAKARTEGRLPQEPPLDVNMSDGEGEVAAAKSSHGTNRDRRESGGSAPGQAAKDNNSHNGHMSHNHPHGGGRPRGHSHDHNQDNSDDADDNSNDHTHKEGVCTNQHVHRLDGQCGHKAIIHQPKNGVAHIDFVVGNKVECYHGMEPMGRNFDSIWPSRYKCGDYDQSCCSKHCGRSDNKTVDKNDSAGNDKNDDSDNKSTISQTVPKIIELSDINLQDPEWNYDVNGTIDGGVMGLFKLGSERQDDAMSTI